MKKVILITIVFLVFIFFEACTLNNTASMSPLSEAETLNKTRQGEVADGDFIYAYFRPIYNIDSEKYELHDGLNYIEYVSSAFLIFKGETDNLQTPIEDHIIISEFKLFINDVLQDTSGFTAHHGGAVQLEDNSIYYPPAISRVVNHGDFFTRYDLFLGKHFEQKPAKYRFEAIVNGVKIYSNTLVWNENGSGEWLSDDMPPPSGHLSLSLPVQISLPSHPSYDKLEYMYYSSSHIIIGNYSGYESSWNSIRNPANPLEEMEEEYLEAQIYDFYVRTAIKGELESDTIRITIPYRWRFTHNNNEIFADDPYFIEPDPKETVMLFLNYNELFDLYAAACVPSTIMIDEDEITHLKSFGTTDQISGMSLEEVLQIIESEIKSK